jgi:hypothetical protein
MSDRDTFIQRLTTPAEMRNSSLAQDNPTHLRAPGA